MSTVAYVAKLIERESIESPIQPTCRAFLLPHLATLKSMPSVSVINALCRKGDLQHNLCFLLALPELWEDMRLQGWSELCQSLPPRPTPAIFDPSGLFTDIMFLIRWLRIDVFRLFRTYDFDSVSDIRQIMTYCRINASLFFYSQSDLEDFDGDVFAPFIQIQSAQRRLLAEDANLAFRPVNDIEFRAYLANMPG